VSQDLPSRSVWPIWFRHLHHQRAKPKRAPVALRRGRIEEKLLVNSGIERRRDHHQFQTVNQQACEPARDKRDKVGFGCNVQRLEITRGDDRGVSANAQGREPVVDLIRRPATTDDGDMPRSEECVDLPKQSTG